MVVAENMFKDKYWWKNTKFDFSAYNSKLKFCYHHQYLSSTNTSTSLCNLFGILPSNLWGSRSLRGFKLINPIFHLYPMILNWLAMLGYQYKGHFIERPSLPPPPYQNIQCTSDINNIHICERVLSLTPTHVHEHTHTHTHAHTRTPIHTYTHTPLVRNVVNKYSRF